MYIVPSFMSVHEDTRYFLFFRPKVFRHVSWENISTICITADISKCDCLHSHKYPTIEVLFVLFFATKPETFPEVYSTSQSFMAQCTLIRIAATRDGYASFLLKFAMGGHHFLMKILDQHQFLIKNGQFSIKIRNKTRI